MDERPVCAICELNSPKGGCTNRACGVCCTHGVTRCTLRAAAVETVRRRLAAERKQLARRREHIDQLLAKQLAAEEKPRRRRSKALRDAALAAAHAKAAGARDAQTTADSPLLALPDGILDVIVRTLDDESPVPAAWLACVHSAFLGAFCRLFHCVQDLKDLQDALNDDGDAAVSAAAQRTLVLCGELHLDDPERDDVRAVETPLLTVVHASVYSYLMGSSFDDDADEGTIASVNAAVRYIHELEVRCGRQDLDFSERQEDEAYVACYDDAEE